MKKLTIEEIKKRLKNVHNNVVTLDESTYKNTYTKSKFIDKDYGEWWAKANDVIYSKKGHWKRKDEKAKNTNLRKYGIKVRIADINFRKIKMLEKYGVENHMLLDEIKNKIKNTNLQRYGVDNPAKNKRIAEKIKNSIKAAHQKDPTISLRSAIAANKIKFLIHWKTKNKIACRGSYEKKVVEWLNKNKIDFDWQIPFNMPNGNIYIIDLFLKQKNIYVEIKGYFRKDAKKKWNWFCKNYPNSELWDEKKLKEMEIL